MRKKLLKYLEAILGIILIAVAFDLFIAPLKIVIGGTSGIALIVNEIFGINTSDFITIFYILMILLNLIVYGFDETKKLIFCSILYPLFISLFEKLPNLIILDYSNKLLLFLIAAVITGIGNGMIYKNGFLCGGTDVLKKIICDILKMPMGNAIFIFDGVLVIIGGILFGVNSVLYAIIILYIISNVTDRIILGVSNKKMFYIMTKYPEEVKQCIKDKLHAGITEMDAVGGYTSDKFHVLMTVISTSDYVKLKKHINEIDEQAFYIITDSYHTHLHSS